MEKIRDFIIKNSKILFPVIVCAAVAVTVVISLRAGNEDPAVLTPESVPVESTGQDEERTVSLVPLEENTNADVTTLMLTYYNAAATGDMETLTSVCDTMLEQDYFHYQEYARYISYYPALKIYAKPGPEEGSTIAYVYYRAVFENHEEEFPGYQAFYICTDEEGNLYVKRGENSKEVNDYIVEVSTQDDVIEFNNRITEEYNNLLLEKPELFEYLSELDAQVNSAVGEQIAKQNATAVSGTAQAGENEEQPSEGEEGQDEGEPFQDQPEDNTEPVVQYVTASTTVNVRSSDSENADKLGKVSGGTKLQLLEQRVNGWSKIIFEGKEGYIKSEYLELVESAEGVETIGTVTASTNINVRASASETADRLGVLAGGETVDLIANENGWCKIKYNGQIGYVKAEYVQ